MFFFLFLQAELTSEKQRYEQLSQQSDADRTAAALAMEEAAKKFSLELSEALTNAKSESEKELGAERERMSAVSSFFRKPVPALRRFTLLLLPFSNQVAFLPFNLFYGWLTPIIYF